MENKEYEIKCGCGAVTVRMYGKPKVHAHCHCEDCRDLLNIPYHSVVAWEADNLHISAGQENTSTFHHPTLKMTRVFCTHCGDTVYNTNALDWKITSQHLIRKNYDGELPEEFMPTAHFYYNERIIDIDDDLPKGK